MVQILLAMVKMDYLIQVVVEVEDMVIIVVMEVMEVRV